MKAAKLIFVLGLITAGSLANVAVAHEHKAERYQQGKQVQHTPIKRMLAGVELTDAQRGQIKQLLQQHRAEQKAQGFDKPQRQQVQALVMADSFDEVAARQLLEQQQQQITEQQLAGLKLKHQVLQVLTEEQRAQLAEKRQQRQRKASQRHTS